MKFDTYAPYLFLVLLAFAQISQTALVTKSARNKLQSLTRSEARSTTRANTRSSTMVKTRNPEDAAYMGEVLKQLLSDPRLIFEMIMGVICTYIGGPICSIYKTIRNVKNNFDQVLQCFRTIRATAQDIGRASSKEIQAIEDQGNQRNGDFEFCKKVKKEISKTFDDNIKQGGRALNQKIGGHVPKGIMDFSSNVVSWSNRHLPIAKNLIANQDWCFASGGKRSQKLVQKFGSMEEYIKQCRYFIGIDCSRFDPSTKNLTSFFKTAYGMFGGIWSSIKCIVEVLKNIPAFKKAAESLNEKVLLFMGGALLSAFGHYITMGIWGGIKGAYYIVKVGIKINDFIQKHLKFFDAIRNKTLGKEELMEILRGLAFTFGGILSHAVSIIKSLIAGRRRFKKLKK